IIIFPDPDAIASAWALKRLLWRKVQIVNIACVRETKRMDNLAMLKLLKINVYPFSEIKLDTFSKFAIVDSQPGHFSELKNIHFHIIIDHHPLSEKIEGDFIDIVPECGATATLLTEYLRRARIKPSSGLATALFYGIKTDTQNFAFRGTERDIKAFRYLFNYVNHTVIRKIESSEISLQNILYFKKAFNVMQVSLTQRRIFIYLGKVKEADICVILADFFLKVAEISWSIVAGCYKNHIIVIFRSDGYRKDAGRLAKKAFGHIGEAGGHKEMARAEIPIKYLKDISGKFNDKSIKRFILDQIDGVIKWH
ncbi:MAG TPA: hypothetical protein ENF30_02785, partial [Candidatus Desulfofervidus auxilii]|nr:hypothetical protein [Candidatus Desulfofervidus auxilii]